MPGAAFLRGDDVTLRTIEEEDLPFLRDAINDPAVRTWLPNRAPVNLDQEREFYEEVICAEDDVNLLVYLDEPAGTIGLHPDEGIEVSGEIGLFLAPDFWGEGYGTEAARLVTDYAFAERGLHRVCARVFAGNVGSRRIWEKLGFRHEATHREAEWVDGEYVDVHWYAVLEDEWSEGG